MLLNHKRFNKIFYRLDIPILSIFALLIILLCRINMPREEDLLDNPLDHMDTNSNKDKDRTKDPDLLLGSPPPPPPPPASTQELHIDPSEKTTSVGGGGKYRYRYKSKYPRRTVRKRAKKK
jgi:hypothetical protein